LPSEDASSIVFVADVPQGDLSRVRPGQSADVDLGAGRAEISGSVHGILPSANAADFTGAVRIDFAGAARLPLGLFGTAKIVVGEHRDALAVPDAAVLRDDVSGVSRIAVISADKLHWIAVTPGLHQEGFTEISGAGVPAEGQVVVSGMVGLPEGKTVAPQK